MRQDVINIIQSNLSRESGKTIVLSNKDERTVNSYRVYINGNKSKLIIGYEELIFFEPQDISITIETLRDKGEL